MLLMTCLNILLPHILTFAFLCLVQLHKNLNLCIWTKHLRPMTIKLLSYPTDKSLTIFKTYIEVVDAIILAL